MDLLTPGLLRCPSCRGGQLLPQADGLACNACARTVEVVEGTLDLRLHPGQDSALDADSYDDAHAVSEDKSEGLFNVYNLGFKLGNREFKDSRILEIGSGTGNLTLALARHSEFSEIHCSDISIRFMREMEKKLAPADQPKLRKYLFDANSFPFEAGQFDAVVGNSILHHLIDFENTLEECRRVLKPGGVAVFGEPMIETKAFVYLAAQQILVVDDMIDEPRLDQTTRKILETVSGIGALKMRNLMNRDEQTAAYEDKFVFPAGHMRETANHLGFSDYQVVEYAPVANLTDIIKRELKRILAPTNANLEAVLSYESLFETFNQSYLPSMGKFIGQTFSLNVFVR